MNLTKLVEKYQLALEESQKAKPQGGLCGLELEWNLLDNHMRPLLTVPTETGEQSFVDYLRSQCLPPQLSKFSQLEVFHWMIEWATRPYYSPQMAVYEGRLLEAIQLNALSRAEKELGTQFYAWHGNLLFATQVSHASIPHSWHLAKRRYLERCIDLYGNSLATAGTHSNLSLPDALFTWDFLHLAPSERGDRHLDEYKSEFYITASRLMRAFCALFIATSASTPLQAKMGEHGPEVRLTDYDSVRNLTFPNPLPLDVPDLYRSYQDYLRLSYELARSGVRFGNNNWTPVRARSFAEPVERLIDLTSDQLEDLYTHELFPVGDIQPMEEMARQIEIQNLMARINLPMARVEVRTDDGGHSLATEISNLTLKHLLLLTFYGDDQFARAFRYDSEDIPRARRNEEAAARHGLRAEIENPLTGKPIAMREFLGWTLAKVKPLALALEIDRFLEPLEEMAKGGSNTAELLRRRVETVLSANKVVPIELLCTLAEERREIVAREVEVIGRYHESMRRAGEEMPSDISRLGDLLQKARQAADTNPRAPIPFWLAPDPPIGSTSHLETATSDTTGDIVALAQELIRIPSITTGLAENLEEVRRAAAFIYNFACGNGLRVHYFDQNKYPALWITFPAFGGGAVKDQAIPQVVLSGHFDVVPPEPDESQFEPRVDGDYLWGRGSADMKTVVATYLVWMKDMLRSGSPLPPLGLLLVGNEENGEIEETGTPHAINWLVEHYQSDEGRQFTPGLLIAGERTGEQGNELWGEICTQNRGIMRMEVIARGKRGHSGTGNVSQDLGERLFEARRRLVEIFEQRLTLYNPDGWKSQGGFPYIQVGTPGIYNITPDQGILGVEIRPIPQDDLALIKQEIQTYCQEQALELRILGYENGVICHPQNPFLVKLVEAVSQEKGQAPIIGRKLAGTSARFAPGGQGVVWGQSGIGPHSADERHYLPSILPYYRALGRFAVLLTQ